MNARLKTISKLLNEQAARESYIRSKLSVLLPAQIRSLRLRRGQKQSELAASAEMKQARISKLEQIGAANFSIETMIHLAAAFRTGLIVKFVPFSDMLKWENDFQPDSFDVTPIEQDRQFRNPNGNENQEQPGMSSGLLEAISGNLNSDKLFTQSSESIWRSACADMPFSSVMLSGEQSQTNVQAKMTTDFQNQSVKGYVA